MIVFVCVLAVAGTANGQSLLDSLTSDLNIRGLTTTLDPETGLATVTGDVHIRYGDIEMRCGSAQYNQATGEVIAKDGVTIWRDGLLYHGDSITYNSITGEMSGRNVITGIGAGSPGIPGTGLSATAGISGNGFKRTAGMFFFRAEDFHSSSKLENRIDATGVSFTSHDVQNPNYRLSVKELTVYPDDKAILKDIKFYAGKRAYFYLPEATKSMNEDANFRFGPGYQSRWGEFLMTQLAVVHGDHTYAKYKFDLRSKRGVGAGVDLISVRYSANRQNFGTLKIYGVNDTAPNTNVTSAIRYPVPQNRYRVNFQHRIYLPGPDVSTWYLDFDINKISDIHFYEDFFFNDARTNPEPDNLISLVHTNDAYVATLMTKFKLNNFYRTTTRLPELSIDFTRRPLWGTNIQHQGTLTAGIIGQLVGQQEKAELQRLQALGAGGMAAVLADPLGTAASEFVSLAGAPINSNLTPVDITQGLSTIATRLQQPGFARIHTYHELLYPKTYMGWLNVTPRIGAGATSYDGIVGSATGLKNYTRGIFHLGLDVSFKLSRSWSDVKVPILGINGIRHVFQPYLNYSYLDAKMNSGVPAIDYLSPTTRPRSIDVPLFTAVDSLRSWDVARIGFRNLFQTKRDYMYSNGYGSFWETPAGGDDQTYTWAGMNTYINVFGKDPEYGRSISNIYNEMFWVPVPWASLKSDLQLPITSGVGSFTEANNSVTWLVNKATSLEMGHQYIYDHPFFRNSSLVYTRLYARLNENYGFSTYHIYEAISGTLQYQSYTFNKDLSSWIASFGFMSRNNGAGKTDIGLMLSFTLKDFPKFNFDLDMDPNPGGRSTNR